MGCCLTVSCLRSPARAEPSPGALAPEPSHSSDEPEFPPATVRAYQRVMERGLSEFVVGRWAEARALFLAGHMLLPNARSARVLGMTAFNLALYPSAARELSQALSDPRRPLRGALREQTEQLLAQAEALVGRYRVLLEPSDAELRVDGLVTKPEKDGTLLMPVGQHLLEVEAPRHLSLARTLLVDGRDDKVLVLRLQTRATAPAFAGEQRGPPLIVKPTPPGPVEPTWQNKVFADYWRTWSLGAGTLVLGSAGLAAQLAANDEARAVEVRCRDGCRPWEGTTAKRDRLDAWGQGLLISSLAFAVTTAVLAFVERDRTGDRERRDRKARLATLREPL